MLVVTYDPNPVQSTYEYHMLWKNLPAFSVSVYPSWWELRLVFPYFPTMIEADLVFMSSSLCKVNQLLHVMLCPLSP